MSKIIKAENFIKFFVLQGNCFDYPMNNNGYFAFHYALKNEFAIESFSHKQQFTIPEGDFFLVKNTNGYKIKSIDQNSCQIITILLSKSTLQNEFSEILDSHSNLVKFINDMTFNYAIPDCNNAIAPLKSSLDQVLYSLLENQNSKNDINQSHLLIVLKELIIYLERTFYINKVSPLPLTLEIIEYIQNNLSSASLAEISKQHNLSSSRFSEVIYKSTGYTFLEILYSERMRKSLELLTTTNETLDDISSKVGYLNTSSFINAFHDKYNMTPGKYRKEFPLNIR